MGLKEQPQIQQRKRRIIVINQYTIMPPLHDRNAAIPHRLWGTSDRGFSFVLSRMEISEELKTICIKEQCDLLYSLYKKYLIQK
jgi:uncharacterized protein YfbU (UPF0304 family)